ncbi:unnamed protein product [Ectocarpus sp. CCAP 1310/34]|nr:unnamed protein product [Ectocarpus sp. CCAP 1310/34]
MGSDTVAASVLLASKVEDFKIHIKDVLIATNKVTNYTIIGRLDPSEAYKRFKNRVVKVENKIMSALGFDFLIEHAYPHANDLILHFQRMGEGRATASSMMCVEISGRGKRAREHALLLSVLGGCGQDQIRTKFTAVLQRVDVLVVPPNPKSFPPHLRLLFQFLTYMVGVVLSEFLTHALPPAVLDSSHSLKWTMCLEYPPTFRARLATYLSLLVNHVRPPQSGEWAEVLQFEDPGQLERVFLVG